MSRVNYLNNRDLLREIHLSKCSFCWFQSPADHQYDCIVNSLADVPEATAVARTNHCTRLGKPSDITPEQIPITALVFRVMTWDHVPQAQEKSNKKKNLKLSGLDETLFETLTEIDPTPEATGTTCPGRVRVNFPPFQHYRYSPQNELVEVGRSHWQGDLRTGEFCRTHGRITDELGRMFLKLTERYGTRGNWRGYTYNDEMRATALLQLSYVGLQFDESRSNNPFGYYTTVLNNSFTRVLNLERLNQEIRDDLMEQHGLTPSYTRQINRHLAWEREV